MDIEITHIYKSLTPDIEYNGLPKFTLITGINGSGKTQLLEYLDQSLRHEADTVFIRTEYEPKLNNTNWQVRNVEDNLHNEEVSILNYLKQKQDGIGRVNNPQFDRFLDFIMRDVAKSSYKDLTPEDIIGRNIEGISNKLQSMDDIRKEFIGYIQANKNRAYIELQKKNEEKALEIANEPSPWDMVNVLFDRYKFKYRLKNPNRTPGFTDFRFENVDTKIEIGLQDLSSGEKMIFSLICWAHNPNTGNKVKYMFLDEIDAYLHPSMSEMLIDIILNTIVKDYGIQVIMTTHSPSTVQYAPDDSIFVMNNNVPRIQKVNKQDAVNILSSGRITISEDNAILMLEDTMANSDKPILCVEGITDKIILDNAWYKLYPDKKMPFYIQPCFDCFFIVNMFLREDVFENNPKIFLLGLLDYDDAYKNWKNKCEGKRKNADIQKYQRCENNWKNSKYNGVILTIPVPDNRKSYAGDSIKDSQLSIEFLFANSIIEEYCEKINMAGGGEILNFKDVNKVRFAKEIVPTLNKEDFINFDILFSNIESILKNTI